MKKVILGTLVACCLGQTIATIFAFAKVHRLERDRSAVWQDGYMEGMNRTLQGSMTQLSEVFKTGRMDSESLKRFVLAGSTNNPFGMPAAKNGFETRYIETK